MLKLVKINHHQIGLRFLNERLAAALPPGWYLVKTIMGERIDVLSEIVCRARRERPTAVERRLRNAFLSPVVGTRF